MKKIKNKCLKTLILPIALGSLSTISEAVPLINGLGGDRGYGDLALLSNDDDSSNSLGLPFEVNFFGNTFNDFFVNNNGNITFNSPVGEFTPTAFPISNQPMIAPFWGDVDTSSVGGGFEGGDGGIIDIGGGAADGSNSVWVASPNAETVVVTWDNVGYYSSATDKLNNFQLVLRDRSADTGTTGDFDVEFRYDQLQWTTGDASGGSGGLGGTPAQAGYDAGNGTDFFVLPGSRTDAILELQNTSNVSADQSGLWVFAIRDGALPGETPGNPLLPVVNDNIWTFEFNIELNQQIFIDPEITVGYDYAISSGPNFQTVLLPSVGDDSYDLYLWNGSEYVLIATIAAGEEYDFGTGGVDRFRILGIEVDAGIDPTDTTAFITGLTFTGSGIVSMSMAPITDAIDPGTSNPGSVTSVPEPSILALLGIGLAGFSFVRRVKRKGITTA